MEPITINDDAQTKQVISTFSITNYDWIGFDLDHTIVRCRE